MKNQLSLLLAVPFIFFLSFSQAQIDGPKCDNERYQNAKLSPDEYKDFNDALDNACKEINKGNYTKAISFLEDAYQKKDAVFVDQEIQKLKEYMAELSTRPQETPAPGTNGQKENVAANPSENKAEEKKVEETPAQPPVENAVMETPPPVVETKSQPEPEAKVEEPVVAKETEVKQVEATPTEPEKKTTDSNDQAPATATEENTPVATDAAPGNKTWETNTTVQTSPPATQGDDSADESVVKTFSDEQKREFQQKGLAKVRQFEQYVNTICSKQTSSEMASQITDNALKLFYNPDENFVEVSSKNRPGKRRLKVQNYLEKLRLLDYDNVIIEWAELNYASDFIKAEDGTYRAYIITRQRFTAMKDNTVTYEDVVTKRIEITIAQYQKSVDGVMTDNYDVFLGDISVDHTE